MAERGAELHEQLIRVGHKLSENDLPDVRRGADKVRITHLEAEIPEGVEELARKAYAKVRPIKFTQLLVEIDQVTHFSWNAPAWGDPARDREALFAAMLAAAANHGLAKMASATPGMARDRLTWHSDEYLRDECYTKMLAEIVNYHHRHPFSAHWGDGNTSSSDGQRFPVGGPHSHPAQINGTYGPADEFMCQTTLSDLTVKAVGFLLVSTALPVRSWNPARRPK